MKKLLKKILAVGLAATMMISTAVVSFAEDGSGATEPPAVTETAKTQDDYIDAGKTATGVTWEDDVSSAVVYANGGKDKATGKVYKQIELKSTFKSAEIVVSADGETPVEKKAGKLVAAVTLTKDIPTVSAGKVTISDAKEAKAVATAKVKDGVITVKAGKTGGTAYVWIIDINAKKEFQDAICIPVTVYGAAKNVYLFEEGKVVKGEGESETDGIIGATYEKNAEGDYVVKAYNTKKAVKKATITVGETVEYPFYGFTAIKSDKSFTAASDENLTYEVTVDEKSKTIISAEIVKEDGEPNRIAIKGLALGTKAGKTAKGKFTVTCKESGKKTSVTVTVENPIKAITFSLPEVEKKNEDYGEGEAKETVKFEEYVEVSNPIVSAQSLAITKDKGAKDGDPFYTITTEAAAMDDATDVIKKLAHTDKVKLYVVNDARLTKPGAEEDSDTTPDIDETKATYYGYVKEVKGKDKFALVKGAKSKDIKAKLSKEGTITITAKKGAKETQAKLLIVATHTDKTFSVYEMPIFVAAAPTLEIAAKDADNGFTAATEATENAPAANAKAEIEVGNSTVATLTLENEIKGLVIKAESDDTAIATATLNADKTELTIKGIAAGTTTIEVTYDKAIKQTIEVTVKAKAATESTPDA